MSFQTKVINPFQTGNQSESRQSKDKDQKRNKSQVRAGMIVESRQRTEKRLFQKRRVILSSDSDDIKEKS